MASVNKVILVGNLGRDPEVRYMPSGDAMVNISLATTDKWKDKKSGQTQERTEWHRIVMFGKIAEVAGEYLKKGSQAYFEGQLQTRSWEKEGVKHYSTEVVCRVMKMLGKAPSGTDQQRMRDEPHMPPQSQQSGFPDGAGDLDDIPF